MTAKPSATETNLAGLVLRHSEIRPAHPALTVAEEWNDDEVIDDIRLSYGELGERIARVRRGLAAAGLRKNDRIVVMCGVRVELYILVLAMLASGMVAVLIDGGMGKKGVIQALRLARAKAIVSIDEILRHRLWVPSLWGLKRYSMDRARLGVRPFSQLEEQEPLKAPVVACEQGTPALITFTSGTTGRPKGANRTHDLLIAQHEALAEHFPARDDEIDMPCFPVVPLHNLCSGISTVLPAVDFRQPASVQPGAVLSQIEAEGVTRLAGAPAYLTRLADHLLASGRRPDTVKTVVCGGAPTSQGLCKKLVELFPDADTTIIYGSTEAEPIASVAMEEFLESHGQGYLVGRVAKAATVALVSLPEPLPILGEDEMEPFSVPPGEIGELVVRGPHVLRGYVDDPQADRETKLAAPDGGVWHRTRDLARVDEEGRIWLLGRSSDSFEIASKRVYPFPIEARVDALEGVARSALIASSNAPTGELLIVIDEGAGNEETRKRVRRYLDDQDLQAVEIDIISELPVDSRHNSKINRPALRARREDL